MNFKLITNFNPAGDQIKAIKQLNFNIENKISHQVLLGGTGTGKTFTIANVINKQNKPTLVLSHNKTLAGQLYSELKQFFPNNNVEYFISNFDFYQPEAYKPSSDLYIEKSSKTNWNIELLRLNALNSILTKKDTIIVASVAAIYGQLSPKEYVKSFFKIEVNQEVGYKWFNKKLVTLNYKRSNKSPLPGEYKVNGDIIDLAPAWSQDYHYRIEFEFEKIEKITKIDFESGEILETLKYLMIYPGQAYTTDNNTIKKAIKTIQDELTIRLEEFKKENKTIEYHRLETRVKNDIENLKETGFCSGIENYARHLDGREKGEKPFTLLDYFPNDSLLIIDESHMMIPQLNAMYLGDYSRKKTLVDYGFRLPSALDNRPLKFNEFENYTFQTIYVSATPDKWEIEKSNFNVVEQIVRPTGLLDPIIEIKETKNQAQIIFNLIQEQKTKNEKTLIMTTTKRAAEILAEYLQEKNQKVSYLHSEHKTFEREEIIRKLRLGTFDVIVGINLLKEGIDIPEVSLICILEADVPGFSRSTKALIQIIGRAARNVNGRVIMFANQITKAMDEAIYETNRRRNIQISYNQKHNITPQTIKKPIPPLIQNQSTLEKVNAYYQQNKNSKNKLSQDQLIKDLTKEMKAAAKKLDFEKAATLRDIIIEISVNEK